MTANEPAAKSTVIVVGAGPAGAVTAALLARRGFGVTLIDKAVFPRDKCCGDGLTTGALRLLEEIGFDPASVPDWTVCDGADIRSPSGRRFTVPFPTGRGQFAAIAPRSQLDHALVRLATAAGATLREGCAFRSVVRNDDAVEITVDDGETLRADWLVAADGMWSPVRRAVGAARAGHLGEWHAFRQYVGGVTGSAADRLHVWFEDDLLPGYAWSFPLPDRTVNFGFGILRREGEATGTMADVWEGLASRPHIAAALGPDAAPLGRRTAWPIPAAIDDAVRGRGRVLFVGDAVCAADSLTGEGIGQALLTAMLAADAVAGGGAPARVARRYGRAIDRAFLADHRMSRLLGRVLARPRGARGALRIMDRSDFTRRAFARWMFEDEPRAAILTPRRWHRGFLRRDGAFAPSAPK